MGRPFRMDVRARIVVNHGARARAVTSVAAVIFFPCFLFEWRKGEGRRSRYVLLRRRQTRYIDGGLFSRAATNAPASI